MRAARWLAGIGTTALALGLGLLHASGAPAAKEPPVPMPALPSLPSGPRGDLVRYGQRLITNTRAELPDHVGNRLTCASCHLEAGTKAFAAPYVGVTKVYPTYRARSGKVDTIEDRINDCFERSLDGKRLAAGSRPLRAIVAYMTWLSAGVPRGREVIGRGFVSLPHLKPDPEKGQHVYKTQCAVCHGPEGQGSDVIPPLWGPQAFNIGAGMARLHTAAAFVQANMPLGRGGTLTAQDAYDVAAFVTRQPRPDFAKKQHDWPKGGKPEDARY